MKYKSEITAWGKDSLFFLEDPETRFIILFNEDAPPELAELSVLHKKGGYMADPEVDDVMIIGDKTFTVTAVGEEARYTLKELGHCTLCFKGGREPERPGCIMLEGDEPLLTTDIQKGAVIEIY